MAPWPLPESPHERVTISPVGNPTTAQLAAKTDRVWSIWDHRSSRSTGPPTADTSLPDVARKGVSAPAKEQRRIKRDTDKRLRQERQENAQEKARKYKEEKQARADEERARNKFIGGVQWGFDATAGRRQSAGPKNDDAGYFMTMGHLPKRPDASCEDDDVGRLTGRRWTEKTPFGIEYGGPGKDGKYGHSSLSSVSSKDQHR